MYTIYPSLLLAILLSRSVLGLPFTSTTTASPAVSQISDGQVQAAADVATPNDQQTSKDVSVTPSDLQTSSANPLPLGTLSVSIQATGEPALDMSMSGIYG